MAVDMLCEKYNLKADKLKFKALCCDGVIAGKRCLLMKPATYMNKSGESVTEAMNFYKIPTDKVIVIFDDISLEPSFLRIKRKGSDGGHNSYNFV